MRPLLSLQWSTANLQLLALNNYFLMTGVVDINVSYF